LDENVPAGIGDSLVGARASFAQQGLELGEDLLDQVQVARVFGREQQASADVSHRAPDGFPPMRAEIVEDHDVARLERWDEKPLDIGVETFAVDGAIESPGEAAEFPAAAQLAGLLERLPTDCNVCNRCFQATSLRGSGCT
jgi:hypothetical protein